MKFIFFGSPEFAKIILAKLIDAGFIPAAVVCNPDRPVGRKKIVTPPPVKEVIREKGLEKSVQIFQPETLSSICSSLSSLSPDLFIVASYSKIIKKEILDIPKLGTIGVHPSLLPKYRGASPIQSAILNGEIITGVTLYMIDEKVDNGPMIAQQEFPISNLQFPELLEKLAKLGGSMLVETLPKFLAGEITPQEQDYDRATFTKKFTTQDGFIENSDLEKAINEGGNIAVKIFNKIRALNPEPGTWTLRQAQGKLQRMKILEAELTLENKLKLKTIQFEGAPRPKIL